MAYHLKLTDTAAGKDMLDLDCDCVIGAVHLEGTQTIQSIGALNVDISAFINTCVTAIRCMVDVNHEIDDSDRFVKMAILEVSKEDLDDARGCI